ncbi:MAG: hypothetical protein SFY68_09890 [Candidatus Sumerlaeia bacterium]|nr:hypothetical protein [Candidatus Sumerlaeia bacterium]
MAYLEILRSTHRAVDASPRPFPIFRHYVVKDFSQVDAERILARTPILAYPEYPENAVRIITPYTVEKTKTWWDVAIDGYLNSSLWGRAGANILPVEPPLPAGRYRFFLYGYKAEQQGETELTVRLPWEERQYPMPNSNVRVTMDIIVPEGRELSQIELLHPAFRPSVTIPGSLDPRELSVGFNGAWFIKLPAK